ncbi:MAG TPA: nucleotidyltransferase family protein, partial [Candidatus Thermoplasmatota archaeon]|nr:nucleotidyltransferase family protein [Candidatus Thermoplasmatota archaeon]
MTTTTDSRPGKRLGWVAVTGLGGSGKTTATEELVKHVNGTRIHYSQMQLLLPRLRGAVKGRDTPPGPSTGGFSVPKPQNGFAVIAKALLAWLDAWIAYYRFFRKFKGTGTIAVSDRYAYDLFVYWNQIAPRWARPIVRGLVRRIPRPDLLIYLHVPPAVSLARKPEGWPLDFLEREYASRDEVLRALRLPVLRIDGTASVPDVLASMKEAVALYQGARWNPSDVAVLAKFSSGFRAAYPHLAATVMPDPARIARATGLNRLAHAWPPLPNGEWTPEYANRKAAWGKTLDTLREVCREADVPILLLKDFLPDLHLKPPSDLDVGVRAADWPRLKAALEKKGPVKATEPGKNTWASDAPFLVDLYVGGIHDHGLPVVGEAFLWREAKPVQGESHVYTPGPSAHALTLIQHAAHETGYVTTFDYLIIRHIVRTQGVDWTAMKAEASARGWAPLYTHWVALANTLEQRSTGAP